MVSQGQKCSNWFNNYQLVTTIKEWWWEWWRNMATKTGQYEIFFFFSSHPITIGSANQVKGGWCSFRWWTKHMKSIFLSRENLSHDKKEITSIWCLAKYCQLQKPNPSLSYNYIKLIGLIVYITKKQLYLVQSLLPLKPNEVHILLCFLL